MCTGQAISCVRYVAIVYIRSMPAKKGAKKAERDQIINIRVTAEQKERFGNAAEAMGMDVSAFMRSAAIEKIERAEAARRPGVLG